MNKTILLLMMTIVLATAASAYIISGESVYFDDAKVFLNVTPHTVMGDGGCTVIELRSKVYTGLVDIFLGVDTEEMMPNKIYYYDEHEVTSTKNYTRAAASGGCRVTTKSGGRLGR